MHTIEGFKQWWHRQEVEGSQCLHGWWIVVPAAKAQSMLRFLKSNTTSCLFKTPLLRLNAHWWEPFICLRAKVCMVLIFMPKQNIQWWAVLRVSHIIPLNLQLWTPKCKEKCEPSTGRYCGSNNKHWHLKHLDN